MAAMTAPATADAGAWIQKLAAAHLAAPEGVGGNNETEPQFASIGNSKELANFLGDANWTILVISTNIKTGAVRFSREVDTKDDAQRSIIISKTRPAVVTHENMVDILEVTPIRNTPLNTLYHTIHAVYAPVLLKSARTGMSARLQGLISELDASLASVLRGASDTKLSEGAAVQIGVITSIESEVAYWVEHAGESNRPKVDQERAAFFRDALQPLAVEFERLGTLPLSALLEAVERAHDVLDDIWRQTEHTAFPKPRMSRLLEIVSELVLGCVQEKLGRRDIIGEPFGHIKDDLVAATDALDRWNDVLRLLTVTYWPVYSPHRWEDEPFASPMITALCERIRKILALRMSHESLIGLMQADEHKELHVEDSMQGFSTFNLLQCSKSTDTAWSAAMAQYNRMIEPVEALCAQKLRSMFGALQSQPSQLLREFRRHSDLVKRETISRQLSSECETLMGQLVASLKTIRSEFRERHQETADLRGRNLPPTVSSIIWARQALAKIEETDETVISLVGPKAAYQALSSELYEDLRKLERDQFDDWAENAERALDNEGSAPGAGPSGRLMELNFETGKLEVSFGDNLITLLREVRQLVAMGFPVSARIQTAAESAQRFYRSGVILKQVAHFYNTIDQQMLPCQQAMLLLPAMSFERLIKDPKGNNSGVASSRQNARSAVAWDNSQELEAYIGKLQASAELLTSENRKFRKLHNVIQEHVLVLMGVDLVKNQSRWKEILGQIRAVIASVQENGVDMDHTLAWRNHWDHQLYKALEHQYQVGLESLNEGLSEIKIDLIFKQQRLMFRPPYEEVRAKYYRELKKFINLPSSFKGLSETAIFGQLVDQNAASLSAVYMRAETLFLNLAKVTDIFKDWVILGTVDLDAFVQDALGDAPDWEMNFRFLKQKGKDAETLPSSIKIDCITVTTAPVKATIDDHLQRLFDALLTSLRKAVANHMSEIDGFVNKGMDILLKRPQTMAEIGEANTRHEELSKSKLSIQSHFESAEAKNKLLKSVAGAGVDMATVQVKWSKLELMLESHELMIKEQVDMLRGAIDGRTQLFMTELEKFTLRWQQFKPKPTEIGKLDSALKAVEFIKERQTEFSELERNAAQITVDSGHFGVSPPDFSELDIVRQDLNKSIEMWSICEHYIEGLNVLRAEDWISFRGKAFQFEEFLALWNEKIRARPTDAISSQLLKDLDTYRSLAANIKFLRGDNWMTEHWAELFRILSVPKGVSVSDLTLGHILDLREAAITRIEEIKELNSRANGEIAIREAMQELDIWAAGSNFALTDYEDARGVRVQLIKEWKETLTQVGDNQSLLMSLKDSAYFKNFAEKALSWEQKLAELDECLRQLNIIQRRWVYLEPIFSRGALPAEQTRFSRIDEDFRSIIASISADPRVVVVVSYPSIRTILPALVDQLERCQKALNEFLEQKRAKFARFYFLGDEDLLEILGQAKNPQVIQAHLKKLFAGVHNVTFDDKVTSIVGMRSLHGEQVPLETPVKITDEVEVWLQDFSVEMKLTLKAQLHRCLAVTDIFKFPSQLIGLAEYLHFTSNVEQAIQSFKAGSRGALASLEKDLRAELDKYTAFESASVQDKTERAVIELKIKSLILDIIHFIDVVEQLMVAGTSSLSDWPWCRQLRFYLTGEQVCVARMNDAEFEYTYEYQGNPPKLVHTPLTDKCYLTLTQAMASGFGGNPFGPAGTGKTESVKALGVLLGRQVLVFNCVAEGTWVNLSDGTAVPIESIRAGQKVLALTSAPTKADSPLLGLDAHQVAAVLDRGEQECVELLLADGRKLVCTADHRLLTSDGEWMEAGRWSTEHDAPCDAPLSVGVDFARVARMQERSQYATWKLPLSNTLGTTLNMSMCQDKALAFFRLIGFMLGYSISSDTVDGPDANIHLSHSIDIQCMLDDIELVSSLRPEPSTVVFDGKTYYRITLPSALVSSAHSMGVTLRSQYSVVTHMPAVVLAADTPLPLVRVFLGGLFGGLEPMFSFESSQTIETQMELEFSWNKHSTTVAAQCDVLQKELCPLLIRAGLHTCTIKPQYDDRGMDDHCRVWLGLLSKQVELFAQNIGLRYCCVKQDQISRVISSSYTAGLARVKCGLSMATKLVHQAQPYDPIQQHSDLVLPLRSMQVMACRPVGFRRVWDLVVPSEKGKYFNSFTANGVVVHNCDEGIDYKSMGRIFVGLVKCGAWGCMDEFNRLEEAVLSAVSQQIQVIQAALKRKEKTVKLLSKTVDIDPNSGIFVTLNPAGKGYGGRQKLPDNLKQLFRSVAMTHPNNELISEVIMFSEGFHLGKELGRKVVSIFTLCKQFLTPQQHYDWGLRPLKAVLGLAGNLLHEESKRGPVDPSKEGAVVVKALRVSTLSKLTFSDAQRFNMLMNDLFPGVEIQEINYEALQKSVHNAYKELGLIYMDSQVEKIFQMYEACRQRMGVVLVGPSGSGKSTIWKLLMHAWQGIGQRLVVHKTNPKAIDRQTLLGHMDMDTREWTDGILTYASRQAAKESLDVHTWIVCDGDIDPEWIESLNSVLDDNRLLTMPNGERIQFGPNVNFIFETHNLKFASPATVSRMGMLFLSDETLDMRIIVNSWLSKQSEKLQAPLKEWIDAYFFKSIEWIKQNSELVVETTKAGVIMSGLSHIGNASDKLQFFYGLIRGLASNMLLEQRLAFANELLTWAGERASDPKRTLDYYVNSAGRLETYQLDEPSNLEMSAMQDLDRLPVIETPDLKRAVDMIMPWLVDGHPFLLVGPEGAGKQTVLRHCFSKLRSTSVSVVHCSAQTKSSHILHRLSQTCIAGTSAKGRVLRPKDGERLILYLKDINLPKQDKYETVELVQFLQQLLTHGGFYGSGLEWISIENIQIVASMNPSTTIGRHKLSVRFTSTIRVGYIAYTDREQLQSIYRILLRPVIERCLPSHRVWSLPKNISKLAATLVSVYEQTVSKFTVDMYSHYLFTPRDLSRLVLSLARFVYVGTDDSELVDVLAWECQRLLQDRLVGADARRKFQELLFSILRTDWNYQGSLQSVVYATAEPGTLASSTSDLNGRVPLVRLSIESYNERITKQLSTYERDVRELRLPLLAETLEIVARVERVLGQPGGSLLLAGRPGVPFTSSVHLVAYGLGYKLVSPKVSRNYSTKAFVADIKQVLQIGGVAGEDVVFLMEDFQLVETGFLESINSLLSGAEVSGVYPQDELDALLGSLKDSHAQEGFRGSLYEYFVSRVRKHLHVVLVLDSASTEFTANCESNPALYTRCQMLWIDTLSTGTMTQLARDMFAKSTSLQSVENKDTLVKELLMIHQQCLSRGGTTRHFIEYLGMYDKVCRTKFDTLRSKQSYLEGGLKKLNEASTYVDRLSSEAKKQQAELSEKQRQADTALKQITESMIEASEQKKEMEALTASLKEEEAKVLSRKQAVEKELAEVEPLIRSAKAAVGEIRPESLSEIRSLRAPPPAIRDVLEGVLRLMGVLDMSWNSMKGFLGQRTIKDEIMNFDAHSISRQTRDAVQELIRQKKDSFEDAVIRRVSVAAAPLAIWVKANLQYSSVVEKVSPLEQDLQRLTATLDASRARVEKLKDQLAAVDRKVQELKEDFGSKTREAESLKSSLDKAMSVIHRAQGLLEKLSGEGGRWKAQADAIQTSVKALPHNGLLAAAFMVYLPDASEDVRLAMTQEWAQVTSIRDFNFARVMSTESEQLVWKSQGLPADALSIENAIISINCRTTSLMIDPSGQAIDWLKRYLKDKKPEVVNQSDDNFIRALELAVRFGKTLIVQEVTHIEPVLMPLLRLDLQKQGPRFVVELGEKTIDYNEDFRLYLVTRRSSFMARSDVVGMLTDINFTITRAGLAGQLLGVTLKHERPELEVQKMELLKNEDNLKLQLSTLEDQLLRELANSEGNILENISLINSLNETKEKSNVISVGLSESQRLQASLDAERDKFTPISTFGSALFFVVSDMQKINNMYRVSLAAFLRLFEEALKTETTSSQDGTELRVKLLINTLEKITFRHVSRSLFKADRQMFALHMVHELHPTLFEPNEWELFTGQLVLADVDDKATDVSDWVPEERKAHSRQLQATLPNLVQSLGFGDKDAWNDWIRSPNCESVFPREKLSPFQKVLVVQALRPDRLLTAMAAFACNALGIDSLSPAPLNLKKLHDDETSSIVPTLFITTPGADPSQDLKEFAAKEVGANKFQQVSMGQGQGELAISLLHEAASSGGWLCLQNIHLVIAWVPTLEKELLTLKPHDKFRLWLTSEAHTRFPPSLLESSLKITIEAPPGVKKNLQRIYENWTADFIQSGTVLRSQALFALAWFHAVVQERRNYIPQGWNKFYEFSTADLRSSAELISDMCSNSTRPPQWAVLHGLFENAIYGGRIDDKQDALKLNTYLRQFFCDEVFVIDNKGPIRRICKSFALPRSNEHAAYRQIIMEFPESDNVELFGLPANIDRTLQKLTSQSVVQQLKVLRQVDAHNQRFDRDKWSQELLPFLQLWKKLNTGVDLLQKKVTPQADADSIVAFFDLELMGALNLIRRIHADLANISKLLRGTMLLSNDIQVVGSAMLRGETPPVWAALWEGPESIQTYLRDVMGKGVAALSLRDKAVSGTLFSEPIMLSNLFNPVTFLNAQRQQTSRMLKQPMDTLRLVSTWNQSELKACPLKIAIQGLLLQGCNFNGDRLLETGANDAIFANVPTCYMGWVPEASVSTSGKLEVPLYVNPSREKVVTTLMVPCLDDSSPWILAGVAFFLSPE